MIYTYYRVTVARRGGQTSWRMRAPWGRDAEDIERELPDGSWVSRQPGTREVPLRVCDVVGADQAARALTWERGSQVVSVEEAA